MTTGTQVGLPRERSVPVYVTFSFSALAPLPWCLPLRPLHSFPGPHAHIPAILASSALGPLASNSHCAWSIHSPPSCSHSCSLITGTFVHRFLPVLMIIVEVHFMYLSRACPTVSLTSLSFLLFFVHVIVHNLFHHSRLPSPPTP